MQRKDKNAPRGVQGGGDGDINPIDAHLGQQLRIARKLSNYTQAKLADEIGTSFQTIQRYEWGVNRISVSRLIAISEAMNVPISFFYDGLRETNPGSELPNFDNVVILSELSTIKSACIRLIANAADDDVSPVHALLARLKFSATSVSNPNSRNGDENTNSICRDFDIP